LWLCLVHAAGIGDSSLMGGLGRSQLGLCTGPSECKVPARGTTTPRQRFRPLAPRLIPVLGTRCEFGTLPAHQHDCNHLPTVSEGKILTQISDDARGAPGAADWPQPNQRDEPRQISAGGRRSAHRPSGTSPRPRSSNQAIKFFSTEKQGEPRRPRRKTIWRFARCSIGLRAKRHTAFLRGLRGSPCFSVLKNLLACVGNRYPGPVIDVFRLADAKRCASREAPALGTGRKRPRISVVSAYHPKFAARRGDLDG